MKNKTILLIALAGLFVGSVAWAIWLYTRTPTPPATVEKTTTTSTVKKVDESKTEEKKKDATELKPVSPTDIAWMIFYVVLMGVTIHLLRKHVVDDAWWRTYWTNGKALPLLVCFIAIHFVIIRVAPIFWNTCINTGLSWSIQAVIGLVGSILPENSKNPLKYSLGKWTLILLGLVFILYLTGWELNEEKIADDLSRISEVGLWKTVFASSNATTSPTLRRAPFTPKGTTKYPRTETWPDKEVTEKILAGQWDLLAACYRESGLTHIDPDTGKPRVYHNTNGSIDTGICQINSVHDEELKRLKLDKTKLRDNLVFALILYNREGLRPWMPKGGEKLVFEIETTKEWSNTFRLPKVIMGFDHAEPIFIAFNDESHVVKENGNELDLTPFTPIADYKFKSATKEKALVTVTYQYK